MADAETSYAPILPTQLRVATTQLVLAVAGGVAVVALFDWSIARVLAGTAAGTVLWGALYFAFEERRSVPRGGLPAPPPGARVRDDGAGWSRRHVAWLLAGLPLAAGLAWLADAMELGALFVPGQWTGMATSVLLAAALVRRYERRHRCRVLAGPDDEDERLFAVPRAR